MERNEEKRETYYITKNFDTPKKIGDMIDLRGAIEGAVVYIPCVKVTSILPLEGTRKITVYVIAFVACLMIGIIGFNGEHISEFAWAVFKHLQRKRITYYNPRAKLEATPDYMAESQRRMLPRDRIMKLIGRSPQENAKYIDSMREEDYNIDYRSIYFEDDTGVVDKPDALKTRKEIREERQADAKQRKELQRKQREKKEELKQRRKELEKKKKAAKKAGINIEDYEAMEALPEKDDTVDANIPAEDTVPVKVSAVEEPEVNLRDMEPDTETDMEEVIDLEDKEPEPPVVDLFAGDDSMELNVELNDMEDREEETVELLTDNGEEDAIELFPQEVQEAEDAPLEDLIELHDKSDSE